MKSIPALLVLTAFGCAPIAVSAQSASKATEEQPAVKVLFIGNSFTYFNNMPAMVEAFSAAATKSPRIQQQSETVGGASLESLWQTPKIRRAIKAEHWDLVVLQEQSSRPLEEPNLMMQYGRYFNTEITRAQAKTLLYQTWPPRRNRKAQRGIEEAYRKLSGKTGAIIVPVGTAWINALERDPGLQLYDADDHHPSMLGSYVAACTFFLVIAENKEPCPPLTLNGFSNESTSIGRSAALQAVAAMTKQAPK